VGDLSDPDSGLLEAIAKQAPHIVSDHIAVVLIVIVDLDRPSLRTTIAPDPMLLAAAADHDVDSL
jgi:hypothetical protein